MSEQSHRDSQSVELVWTGPDTEATPFRRTEQAILQVLDAAKSRITLVSFAVYKIPNVGKALVRAAKRGVRLTVIVETPDKLGGENEYNTIKALGQEVAACATVYFWPKDNRAVSKNGTPGILHVKCAVADGEWLFLSSANLTEQAFTINMELGMLVRGGTMPSRVGRGVWAHARQGDLLPPTQRTIAGIRPSIPSNRTGRGDTSVGRRLRRTQRCESSAVDTLAAYKKASA